MTSKKIDLRGDGQYARLFDGQVLIREEPEGDGGFWHGIAVKYEDLVDILEAGFQPIGERPTGPDAEEAFVAGWMAARHRGKLSPDAEPIEERTARTWYRKWSGTNE